MRAFAPPRRKYAQIECACTRVKRRFAHIVVKCFRYCGAKKCDFCARRLVIKENIYAEGAFHRALQQLGSVPRAAVF